MPEPESKRPRWTGAAVALVVIGLLILIPSGLCTAVMGIAGVASVFTGESSGLSLLFGALVVGGPFVAGGAALVYGGIRARKSGAPESPSIPD